MSERQDIPHKIAEILLTAIGKTEKKHYTSAVILAAGNSTRMGKENKQFCYLNGKPVLAHTLLAYQKCPLIREIIVVAKPSDFKKIFSIAKQYGINKLTQIVGGGETRQESARRGVAKVSEETKFVAI